MILPAKKDLALKRLAVMGQLVGEGRDNDPSEIAKILAVQGLAYEIGGIPVAFCDATVGFADCKALAELAGIPFSADNAVQVFRDTCLPLVREHYWPVSASVAITREQAIARGLWLDVDDIGPDVAILPGWQICYKFSETDHHTGLVLEDDGDVIKTVEGNTTCAGHSGVIANKSRTWSCIWGFVRAY